MRRAYTIIIILPWSESSYNDNDDDHHDWVGPPNVRVISQMSLDRTGMELNVILAEIVVLMVMMIQGGFIHWSPNFSTAKQPITATVAVKTATVTKKG